MKRKNNISKVLLITVLVITFFTSGCMRYLTHNRGEVLLEGVDIDQTLEVAEIYLKDKEGGLGSSLAIWAVRDQYYTPEQAEKVSKLYFKYIDGLEKKFDIWHLTWAVSNIYRLGHEEVKQAIQEAYNDATRRAEKLSNIADKMANGEKLYLGDAHGGGRAFAKKHVVVPSNRKYIQSVEEYKERRKKREKDKSEES